MASKPIISAGLEPVLSHTEKSCIATYYRQFLTRLIPVLLAWSFGLPGLTKLVIILFFFHFDIRGKLSIIQCDK